MPIDAKAAKAIFMNALDKSDAVERAAYLAQACGGDELLRQRVDLLLRAHSEPGSFLESKAPPAGPNEPIAELIGSTIGPYKLIEQIGEGGFSIVFMAEQTQPVRRKVAFKILKPGMDTRQVVTRFEAERQAVALMDHPNIAKVLDAGATSSGRPYFVMELIKGVPITEFCDQNHLTLRQRLELFVSACSAVQHAHQKGIIHRDLKPSNVLVALYDDKPVPKVIDFGIAKAIGQQLTEHTLHTGFWAVVGTLEYMSPEQASFNQLDIDTRSDIYSLGILLYELLTGTTPLRRDRAKEAGMLEVLRLIREEDAPTLSDRLSSTAELPSIANERGLEPAKLTRQVQGELNWIAMKALEKDRDRRYATATAFAVDVERYLSDEPVQACPPSTTYRFRKIARKYRKALVTAAAFALLLVAGVVFSAWQAIQATHAAVAERQAKYEALAAAEAEKKAHGQAQKRLAQIEKGNEIITAIFNDLDIRNVKQEAAPLEAVLVKRLVQAAKQLEGEAVGDPVVVAGLQGRLGLSLLHLGHPQAAIPLFIKARATQATELGADHPDTLMSMNNLACAYQDAAKLDLALPLFEETLRLRKTKLRADHPDTLLSMNNLADCYRAAGKLDLAVSLFEETLGLSKLKLGADHSTTLLIMNNLALGYRAVGKLDLALPLFKETLEISKAKLGADHPDTLVTMNNLADSYRAAGKLDLALPLLEETLKLRKARLGADHAGTLRSMNVLASGYFAAGKLDLALPLFEETLRLRKAKLGADHPDTLFSMNNLAEGYRAARKLDRALPLYEETLKLRKIKLGADHPDTLTSMNNLAVGYQDAGKLDLALPLYQEAAAGVEKRRFRHEHAHLIIPNLSGCHELLKQFAQAETWRRKWLAVVKERTGTESTAYAAALAALGLNLLQQQKWSEAESVLKESLVIRQNNAPEAWTTFNTQSLLGGALVGLKKYVDAERLLLAGYEGMKGRENSIPPSVKDLRLREALCRLVKVYEDWDKRDKAEEWRKKLEEQKK